MYEFFNYKNYMKFRQKFLESLPEPLITPPSATIRRVMKFGGFEKNIFIELEGTLVFITKRKHKRIAKK